MCLELTVKTPEWHQWLWSDVFINFQQISHVSHGVSVGDFKQVNAGSEDEL